MVSQGFCSKFPVITPLLFIYASPRYYKDLKMNTMMLTFCLFANNICLDCVEKELITPPLNGLILPGITRKSLLELAKSWVSSC